MERDDELVLAGGAILGLFPTELNCVECIDKSIWSVDDDGEKFESIWYLAMYCSQEIHDSVIDDLASSTE